MIKVKIIEHRVAVKISNMEAVCRKKKSKTVQSEICERGPIRATRRRISVSFALVLVARTVKVTFYLQILTVSRATSL